MLSSAISASWCDPCMKLMPVLERKVKDLSAQNPDAAPRLVKIDIDHYEELASHYKVSTIPCLILVRNGKDVMRLEGKSMNQANFEKFIKQSADIGSDNVNK